MAKYILENKRDKSKVEGEFEDLKLNLSDLTEKDKSIPDSKWEEIQLLTPERLPFRAGKFLFRKEDDQGKVMETKKKMPLEAERESKR